MCAVYITFSNNAHDGVSQLQMCHKFGVPKALVLLFAFIN